MKVLIRPDKEFKGEGLYYYVLNWKLYGVQQQHGLIEVCYESDAFPGQKYLHNARRFLMAYTEHGSFETSQGWLTRHCIFIGKVKPYYLI